MSIRRAADPISVQHVWDAIRCAVLQHQQADIKRIIKYLQRVDKCTLTQAELYIQQTLKDGLIVALQKVNVKGEEVESFRIPTQDVPELDGKDWYCFECHLGGDVTACKQCFRVFHADCVTSGMKKFEEFKKTSRTSGIIPTNANDNDTINISSETEDVLNSSLDLGTYKLNNNKEIIDDGYNDSWCSICNIAKLDNYCLEKNELNYLLKFVIHRIQSWLPNTITHTMAEEDRPEWLTDRELTWRANQLFFEHRDMSVIEVNLNNESYDKLYQFLADVLTIQHNVAIFHGIESQEYGAAELMVRDCLHDLTELMVCVDCYRHSNEKINSRWFCLPCRVPHQLVWAKQKGYPYWPAKVIRETVSHFDVRFFGGKYERSLLGKAFVKPIDTPKEKLQIKSSSAFNKSVEELKYHQKLLENPDELQKLIESSKNKIKALKKASPLLKKPRSDTETKTPVDYLDVYQFDEDVPCVQNTSYSQKRKNSYLEGSPGKKRSSTSSLPEKKLDTKTTPNESVINISDGEEDAKFSYRESYANLDYDGSFEQVSSSTENYSAQTSGVNTQDGGMQQLDHPYSDSVERMRRKIECLTDKKDIIKCAMDCMQSEIDKITNDHNDHLKRLFESHNAQISETKKKQWCYNCEQDAIYHCCWNTAYCSQSCQQQHWQSEHKKVCRRKR